jgi:hypothetical protein
MDGEPDGDAILDILPQFNSIQINKW